jgi:hypothetical protein
MVDNPPIADSFPGKVVLKAAPQYFCQRWGLLITLVQEGRRQKKKRLYSKLCSLFQLDSYFCYAALGIQKLF